MSFQTLLQEEEEESNKNKNKKKNAIAANMDWGKKKTDLHKRMAELSDDVLEGICGGKIKVVLLRVVALMMTILIFSSFL